MVYAFTLVYSTKAIAVISVDFVSHSLKVRVPSSSGNDLMPFESAFSLYRGYHSVGSPFAPKCFPGPACAATSSIRGSQLSFRKRLRRPWS
jgi:hypothetical protein